MTKHMCLALLIFGIIPLIILFLCREPIINNIKLFFEDKEPIEWYDYHIDSTEYFDDVSDSLILDSIRIESFKSFYGGSISNDIEYIWYDAICIPNVCIRSGDILEITEVNDSNMVATFNNDTLIFKRINQ